MFNENKITHNFAVLSDIHISGIWGMENREAHFKNVIKFCKEQASGRLDAFLMNGDFTDAMNSVPNVVINEAGFSRDFEEAKAIQTANEFRILRSCLATIDEDTDIVYTLGNHDGCNNNNIERFITEFSSRDEIGDNKNFERMYRTDLDLDSMRNGVRHCVVGGYHILALDMFTDYTEPVAKIKSWLDEITAAEPEKFVFVMFHCKTPGTLPCSDGWGSNKLLGDLLKNYPQVVLITGHTHTPIEGERFIWQGEYTALEAASMDCMTISEQKLLNVPHNLTFTRSYGLMLQIDDEGNLRIKRFEFKKETEIGEAAIIPAPKADKSHLSLYTDKRAYQYTAPEFKEGTVLTIKKNEDGKIDISFPAAECEGNVFRYEITVTDSCGKTENFFLSSYYCLDSDDKSVVSGTLPYDFSRAVRISVTPQDLWFKCGKPLTYNIY